MGRHCGWLTAKTAKDYRDRLKDKVFLPELMVERSKWDIDAIYIPEQDFIFQNEVDRLRNLMDEKDNVNIFLSEGAGQSAIVREIEEKGDEVPRDAFGHVRLDEINPGQWFAKKFSSALKAEKTLVQKSGYFARSSKANAQDLKLIKRSAFFAAEQGLNGKSGLAGLDEDKDNQLRLINFKRIKGGKPFDLSLDWYKSMLDEIKQK
jgi:pyrophosphate--fructose-6-phosphate 1-phosphotransferase